MSGPVQAWGVVEWQEEEYWLLNDNYNCQGIQPGQKIPECRAADVSPVNLHHVFLPPVADLCGQH